MRGPIFVLLFISLCACTCLGSEPRQLRLKVTSRDIDWGPHPHRRLLLRNSSIPLHGAVKEFGYVCRLLACRACVLTLSSVQEYHIQVANRHPSPWTSTQLLLCQCLPGLPRPQVQRDRGYGKHHDLHSLCRVRELLWTQSLGEACSAALWEPHLLGIGTRPWTE